MAKWRPPHPAKQITTPTRCRLGQRYSSVDKVKAVTCGPLAVSLHVVSCTWCQGGYHLVNSAELSRYRNVFTEVTK